MTRRPSPSQPLPFSLESPLEQRLALDPEWRRGIEWGKPRSGHPEGAVKWHIGEVLANLDRLALPAIERTRLRLAALVHDSFKHRIDHTVPRIPPNEHGFLAAQFLAPLVPDPRLLSLIELHDEGYRAWRAAQYGNDEQIWGRLAAIAGRMGPDLSLFVTFYWADNRSGDKEPGQLDWFVERLADLGFTATVPRP